MGQQKLSLARMKLSTVRSLEKGSGAAIGGVWFLALMVAMVLAVYIIQMVKIPASAIEDLSPILPFMNGGEGFNSYGLQYMKQTIASTGSIFILFGITLVARNKRAYGPFSIMGNVLVLVNGLLTGLWFEATTRTIMTVLYTYQYATWNKRAQESGEEMGRADKKEWGVVIGLVAFALILALVFSYVKLPTTTPDGVPATVAYYLGSTPGLPMIADAMQGILNITAIYLTTRRKSEGQLSYVVSNTFALIMFAMEGQAVMMVSTAAFWLVSLLAWIQWEALYVEQQDEKAGQKSFMYIWRVKQLSMEEKLATQSVTTIKSSKLGKLDGGNRTLATKDVSGPLPTRKHLAKLTKAELIADAKELGATGYSKATKDELVEIVFKAFRE